MSLECLIGPEGNLLSTEKENAHRLRLEHPILSNEEFLKIGFTARAHDFVNKFKYKKKNNFKDDFQNIRNS